MSIIGKPLDLACGGRFHPPRFHWADDWTYVTYYVQRDVVPPIVQPLWETVGSANPSWQSIYNYLEDYARST